MTDMNNSTLKQKLLEVADWLEDSHAKKNKVLAAFLRLAAERIPQDGWVSVPIEPTEEMRTAFRSFSDKGFNARYVDMIAARPETKKE